MNAIKPAHVNATSVSRTCASLKLYIEIPIMNQETERVSYSQKSHKTKGSLIVWRLY